MSDSNNIPRHPYGDNRYSASVAECIPEIARICLQQPALFSPAERCFLNRMIVNQRLLDASERVLFLALQVRALQAQLRARKGGH